MGDGEHDIPGIEETPGKDPPLLRVIQQIPPARQVRRPPSGDGHDDPGIDARIPRREDVHDQAHAVLVAVYDVFQLIDVCHMETLSIIF